MRKIILIIFLILLVLATAFYLFANKQNVITTAIRIHAAQNAVLRCLTEKEKWQAWWPAQMNELQYPEDNFSMQQKLFSRVPVFVNSNNDNNLSYITIASLATDTCSAIWQYPLPPTSNPIKKISVHLQSGKIKRHFQEVLTALKEFAENTDNVYGIKIQQVKVKDSALVIVKSETSGYPNTTTIYNLIYELKQYINSSGAIETDYPMMHIQELKSNRYQVMVAIPVNTPLRGNGRVEPRRMVLGNILVAEVNGGTETVKQAMMEMENYVYDYRKSSPAIPFVMLVTDRLKQPDTTQWVTRIYYPIY